MGPFEYLLTFISVILGLAVSDVAISLHRLLGAGRRVRWDWLAPLAAIVAFLKIVNQWWAWFATAQVARSLTFEMFVMVLAATVMMFLLAAAALPDELGEGPVDLRAHYAAVARRYWLLFASELAVIIGVETWGQIAIGHARPDVRALLLSPVSAIIVASVVLAFVRNRWIHTLALIGLIALYMGKSFGHSLSN
jgi:hypothetical protein